MANVELKTKLNDASVAKFLGAVKDPQRRKDCQAVLKIMQAATKSPPKMWGTSIVGFGTYHYIGKSGREGDWMLTGFSPRKQNLTLYIMAGFKRYPALMKKLGKYKTGVGCLYLNSLEDVHAPTLKALVKESVKFMTALSKKNLKAKKK
ncbi:MAG: DUF1801 domain-containing protein [Ignavibacteriae bacterium]|nr:DUF1801 domain-containing protein [Ignavibacteriota bacterium]